MLIGDIGPETDWNAALEGIDTVIHAAAEVHVTGPLDAARFERVNVAGTERLARCAAERGARRLIFLSTIAVHGSGPHPEPINEQSRVAPVGPYALSKLEAELRLLRIGDETGLEVVVVRPPLVYGPAAPGNFARLKQLVLRGIPLPLGRITNLRSFMFVGNLGDLLCAAAERSEAAGQVFIASDGEDLSTPELIRRMAAAAGRRARLVPVPAALLKGAAALAGRAEELTKLVDSFVVDSAHVRKTLDWRPPFSVREGLELSMRAADGSALPRRSVHQ